MTLTTISLFSGVGGLDFGFEAAGYETRFVTDFDALACASLQRNRPSWALEETPIADLTVQRIIRRSGLGVGEADILVGGPPCQPFSKSGYWAKGGARRLEDPRADTLAHYMRILEGTKPRAFLIENVPGMAYRGKNEGLIAVKDALNKINHRADTGYRAHATVLNAADYGVPQTRERLFVVGFRDGSNFSFPKPTHGNAIKGDKNDCRLPYSRSWDAIGDLGEPPESEKLSLRGKWADLLPSIPEGSNYLHHTERGDGEPLFGWRRRYWNFLLKIAKNRPSWTIQAKPGPSTGPFHWDNRRLSSYELARLQTFPDGLWLGDSIVEAQRLVGNAVSSLLAEMLAYQISQALGLPNVDFKPKLCINRAIDIPRPREPTQVPSKYLMLRNSDTSHPGTGKGRGRVNGKEVIT